MKSYVLYLQGLYGAMLSSIAEYDPSLRQDCERDASRLLSLVNTRGISFLMIDLPQSGKHFDRCLTDGRLTRYRMAGFRPFRSRGIIPRLFKGLHLRVFDEVGMLRADIDPQMIRFLRQLFYAAKKVKVPCSDSSTWEHVHEFFDIDQEVQLPTLNWDDSELCKDKLATLSLSVSGAVFSVPLFPNLESQGEGGAESSLYIGKALTSVQMTADIVSSILGGFNPLEWRTKHGPGAVSDQRHTQFKYDFPNWPEKLSNVFPLADFGFPNFASWAAFVRTQDANAGFRLHEPPSRLIAVPKTLKGPRLIAAEPVAHQWCQQSILDFLVTRIAKTPISSSIRFKDQSANAKLALRASHTQ